jgi:hypothetical protein
MAKGGEEEVMNVEGGRASDNLGESQDNDYRTYRTAP